MCRPHFADVKIAILGCSSRAVERGGDSPITTHPVHLQVKIKITPSFSSVLVSRGDAETRSRVNEIFLVALFEISTFLCCHVLVTPRRHYFERSK